MKVNINRLYSKEAFSGVVLVLVVSLIISVGVKWILSFVLIPLLLFLTLLGINISFEPEILSWGISILSFVLALLYLIFGERLVKND